MEHSQLPWVVNCWASCRKVFTWASVQVKKRFQRLKNRYGPRYTVAMLVAVVIGLFLPIPGATLIAVGLVAVVGEIHRLITRRGGFSKAIGAWPRRHVMSIECDVLVKWSATPDQLRTLGAALWRRCNRTAGKTGIYQYLDNQTLADLIAGKLPVSSQPPLDTDRRGVHFRLREEASDDLRATLDGLRRDLPAGGIEDVVVEGTSWNSVATEAQPRPTLESWDKTMAD